MTFSVLGKEAKEFVCPLSQARLPQEDRSSPEANSVLTLDFPDSGTVEILFLSSMNHFVFFSSLN